MVQLDVFTQIQFQEVVFTVLHILNNDYESQNIECFCFGKHD